MSLGKSDFEAIEPFRTDRFFKEALGLSNVPSSVWNGKRLDAKAEAIRERVDELSLRLLERTEAPITAHRGDVCVDIDTVALDNSGTKKEAVTRTDLGFDGYTPIAAYLGNEGWAIGLEWRPGSQHSASETEYFYERLFPRIERLVQADQPVLLREDSGFDSARLLFAKVEERDRLALLGRSFDFLCKWNPRRQDKAAWVAQAEAAGAFEETRPGKRIALLSVEVERAWAKKTRRFRLIVQVTERTIDQPEGRRTPRRGGPERSEGFGAAEHKNGQHLLVPDIELQGWWTSLDATPQEVIDLYKHHGVHEPFHSELKTDLDMERLPSGQFDTNDVVLHRAAFAYNGLRLLGQLGLTGEDRAASTPGQTSALSETVLQEIMYRAANPSTGSGQGSWPMPAASCWTSGAA